jgi:fibronectin-binding autotransporter adhesin
MADRALSRWIISISLALAALAAISLWLTQAPVQAKHSATLINCSGSIQACINAASDGDTILIAAGRYTESLTLSKPVSLTGINRDTTIIHAVAGQRVLTVTGTTINNSVVISGLTFTGGYADQGGGIYADVSLTVMSSRFISNSTIYGGGLYIIGSAALSDVNFEDNTCRNTSGQGGGINARNGTLSLTRAVFIRNTCTAVYSENSPTTIVDSRFEQNSGSVGGGVWVYRVSASVSNTVFLSNTANLYGGGLIAIDPFISGGRFQSNTAPQGGGIYGLGTATITGTEFISNTASDSGGGAYLGAATIANSRFERNTCLSPYPGGQHGGGGLTVIDLSLSNTVFVSNTSMTNGSAIELWNDGYSATIVNSLFAHNEAANNGAVIKAGVGAQSPGQIVLENSTISDKDANTAPAVVLGLGTHYLTNTIITNHAIAISNTNGTVFEDYNLFFGNITNTIGVITGVHSLIGDPRFVDPLHGDYHLQFGSVAIDHGSDAGVTTDLDGNPRPVGSDYDIGAYEFVGGPASGTRYVATTGTDTANDCLNGVSPCATIQHAIDVANDGEQVLMAGGLYTESATLSKPVSLTGVSSDTTIIHAMPGQRVLTVTGATISNSVVISGLTFTGGQAGLGAGLLITESAHPSIRNIAVQGNFATAYGGGVYAANALSLSNSQFSDNWAYANGSGGGIYVVGAADIANSHFANNVSPYGAGVYALGGARIISTDFISNLATEGAGVNAASAVAISGGQFFGNLASGGGGSAVAADHALSITGTQFVSNTASEEGGAVIAFNGPVTITDAQFIRNHTTLKSGGAVYVLSGTLAIRQSQFISNTAHANGGALFANDATTLTHVDFISNTVSSSGGALFTNGTLWVNQGRFIENKCLGLDCGGGAILVDGALATHANLVIRGTQFIGNSAAQSGSVGGAVYYGSNGAVYIVNALFARNTAQRYGAALFLNWGEVANFNYLTIADESLNPVAALTIFNDIPVAINNSIIVSHTIGIENVARGILQSHNLFFGNLENTYGRIGGGPSFVGDPRFVDPLHDDYHLRFGSAAIDHGIDAGVTTDLDGNPRPVGAGFDIGAYEYQGGYYLWLPLIWK